MAKTATTPLTGKALLKKAKEQGNLSRRELAKACGYFTTSKSNETRVDLAEFYDALLAARGIDLDPQSQKEGRGREANYRVSVHKNGSLVIGSNYTVEMGLKPGDEFKIKLGYKHIQLRLVSSSEPIVQEEPEEEEE